MAKKEPQKDDLKILVEAIIDLTDAINDMIKTQTWQAMILSYIVNKATETERCEK